ncbi:MAG: cell division protein PerM [Mycobacteriales bacterium]
MWAYADDVTRRGLLAGALGLVALVAAGSIMYAFALTASVGTAGELFRQIAPGAGSGFGLWLLSLCYLPNALVGGLAFISGAGLDVGAVQLSPFLFSGGNVPAMPLLAALPERFAAWWPAVLILPLVVGILVGFSVRRSSPDPLVRLRVVGVAGLVVAVGCLVLAAAASGALGDGAVTVPAGRLALLGLGWIVVPAAVVAWFAGPSGGGGPVAEAEWPAEFAAEPELDTEPEPLAADPLAGTEPEPDDDAEPEAVTGDDSDGESKGS